MGVSGFALVRTSGCDRRRAAPRTFECCAFVYLIPPFPFLTHPPKTIAAFFLAVSFIHICTQSPTVRFGKGHRSATCPQPSDPIAASLYCEYHDSAPVSRRTSVRPSRRRRRRPTASTKPPEKKSTSFFSLLGIVVAAPQRSAPRATTTNTRTVFFPSLLPTEAKLTSNSVRPPPPSCIRQVSASSPCHIAKREWTWLPPPRKPKKPLSRRAMSLLPKSLAAASRHLMTTKVDNKAHHIAPAMAWHFHDIPVP